MIDAARIRSSAAGCWAAARQYTAMGFHVVPLYSMMPSGSDFCSCGKGQACPENTRAKHPILKGWQKNASTDPAVINKWGRQFPRANIGVLLGAKSGIIDVEYDTDEGRQTAERLLNGVQTPTYKSGSRSVHRLFRWRDDLPGGAVIHVAGLEIRTGNDKKGAQSVFPPSIHRTGKPYEWIIPPEQAAPAPIPPALLALIANAVDDKELKGHQGAAPQKKIDDRELSLDALAGLNKNRAISYDDWLAVGMALHSVDSTLLSAWDEWSQSCSEKYKAGVCAEHWKSFTAGGGVGLGSLFHWAQQDGWKAPWERNGHLKKSNAKKSNRPERVSNAIVKITGTGDEEKVTVTPRPMTEIVDLVSERTASQLRRVDKAVFAHVPGGVIHWLDSSAAMFGFLQTWCGIVEWRKGPGFVSKVECYCELRRQAPNYDAIEDTPHWPAMQGHYYACPLIEPGSGKALQNLLDRFSPATDIDRDLILAAMMTTLWGGSPGCRPGFVVTSDDGRGAGKSTLANLIAELFGGGLTFSHLEDIGKIKTRLLSPIALPRRVCLLDNVKSLKFSWADLEALITAMRISGHQMYLGEGSRPNTLTWFITLNGASLSTDLSQRCVVIKLARPVRSATWEESTRLFIHDNQNAILSDLAGVLSQSPHPLASFTRWATWEKDVLQRLPEPGEAQKVILERQGETDIESEEIEIVEDFFAEQLRRLDYGVDGQRIFIPTAVAARWFGWATNQKVTTGGAGRILTQMITEGRTCRLSLSPSRSHGRGYIWWPPGADVSTTLHADLEYRIRANSQDGKDV